MLLVCRVAGTGNNSHTWCKVKCISRFEGENSSLDHSRQIGRFSQIRSLCYRTTRDGRFTPSLAPHTFFKSLFLCWKSQRLRSGRNVGS